VLKHEGEHERSASPLVNANKSNHQPVGPGVFHISAFALQRRYFTFNPGDYPGVRSFAHGESTRNAPAYPTPAGNNIDLPHPDHHCCRNTDPDRSPSGCAIDHLEPGYPEFDPGDRGYPGQSISHPWLDDRCAFHLQSSGDFAPGIDGTVSFYLIKDGPALRAWFETLPPPHYQEDYIRLRDEISTIWGSFFRGQLILALVVAIIFTSIGFLIGLPFALAMGVLAGLLEFLPSLGHGIWLFLASLLAFFIGSTWLPLPNWIFTLIVIGLHLAYQQFDLNYLIPRIIGHSVHLPPLVVILGIVAGAVLAPTIASIRVIGRYVFANLYDLDPFPNPITKSQPEPNYPKWWNYFRKEKRHS
jgi:hypothetical protein